MAWQGLELVGTIKKNYLKNFSTSLMEQPAGRFPMKTLETSIVCDLLPQ